MAYTELHTAALRLVHVTRPNDRDMDYLLREFHLTPADAEALLGVSETTHLVGNDHYRRLTLQWPTPTRRGIVVSDVHILVAYGWLIVVDHGDFSAATEVLEELQTMPSERMWQDDAMMMLYEILRRAIRGLQHVGAELSPQQSVAFARARSAIAETIKNFPLNTTATDETIKGFSFLAFSLNHHNPAGARAPVAMPNRLPFSARGYAAASAAVAIMTLIVMSRSL